MSNLRPNDLTADALAFLPGGGEIGKRTREFDWSQTPIGQAACRPQSLMTVMRLMLDSRYPMFVAWGPDKVGSRLSKSLAEIDANGPRGA